jgi:hypothetical protein
MTKTMAEGLNFKGDKVFLDGETIFVIPVRHATMDTVTVVGFWERSKDDPSPTIYVGSGTCCHGHLYELEKHGENVPYVLDQVIAVGTNLMDILPAVVNYEKAGFPNGNGVLVVGYGCAGAGVRLISTYYPRCVDVVSTEQFRSQIQHGQHTSPVFRVDKSTGTIHLDFRWAGWRVKAGMYRDPALPSILADSQTEEFYVSSADLLATIDLSPRLEEVGVDVRKTIELVTNYRRLLRH